MNKMKTIGRCAALVVAAGMLVAPAALAQNQTPSSPPATKPGPSTSPTNISDSKLDQAAAAARDVSQISDRYRPKVAQAPPAEKERIVGEANDAMTKAITDKGLSVDEYMTIMKVAQSDPVVRGKLVQRMK